jgi:hypothetical protein
MQKKKKKKKRKPRAGGIKIKQGRGESKCGQLF